jgi:hypothetical protein
MAPRHLPKRNDGGKAGSESPILVGKSPDLFGPGQSPIASAGSSAARSAMADSKAGDGRPFQFANLRAAKMLAGISKTPFLRDVSR